MTSTLAVIDEFRSRARYVSPLDNSSGSLAGVYAILVGQHAPTDLAGELQWQQRGHNLSLGA
jgi:hypothetical protein